VRSLTFHVAVAALAMVAAAACGQLQRFLVPPPEDRPTTAAVLHAPDLIVTAGGMRGADGPVGLVLRDGRIDARTTPALAEAIAGKAPVMRMRTAVVAPGFVDAHVHLEGTALLADALDLRHCTDEAGLRKALAGHPQQVPWTWGWGLPLDLWQRLDARTLDQLAPDRPLYLSRADGHGALCSTTATRLLPAELVREVTAASGRIAEDLAERAWRQLPPPAIQRLKPLVLELLVRMQRQGITEVHAMGASAGLYAALLELEAEGRLGTRVRLYLDGAREEGRRLLQTGERPGEVAAAAGVHRFRSRLLTVAGVKLWLDGTLGARTAALQSPYADDPGRGRLRHTDAEVGEWIQLGDACGVQVALHAVGDAAVAQITRVLNGLNRSSTAPLVRIEHAQVVPDDVLARLRNQRIMFSIQPLHATEDLPFARLRLGPERSAWAYRAASLAAAATVVTGSDMPVSDTKPLAAWRNLAQVGVDAATIGRAANETLDVDLALRALCGGTDREPLAPGQPADFVVWPRDPVLLLAGGEGVEPLLVVVDGVPVWQAMDR
jgi:predicted amidohydrolase YtcJ